MRELCAAAVILSLPPILSMLPFFSSALWWPLVAPFMAALAKVAGLLLVVVAIVDVLTMGTYRRARIMRRSGATYRAIGARLGVSATTARRYVLAV